MNELDFRSCKNCGKDFVPNQPHQKYCGRECLKDWYASDHEWDKSPRTCDYCGSQFVPKQPNQKYCNQKCGNLFWVDSFEKSKWDKSPRTCDWCGSQFVPKQPNQKYCGKKCTTAKWKQSNKQNYIKREWNTGPRVCGNCESEFVPDVVNQRYCNDCRQNCKSLYWNKSEPKQAESATKKRGPIGRYVYLWYKDNEPLPFYVGKGVGDRAYTEHTHCDGGATRLAYCERVRKSAKNFKVMIIRDNLTEEGAKLVESAFIQLFISMGVVLTNQTGPMSRQEHGNLELYCSQ